MLLKVGDDANRKGAYRRVSDTYTPSLRQGTRTLLAPVGRGRAGNGRRSLGCHGYPPGRAWVATASPLMRVQSLKLHDLLLNTSRF